MSQPSLRAGAIRGIGALHRAALLAGALLLMRVPSASAQSTLTVAFKAGGSASVSTTGYRGGAPTRFPDVVLTAEMTNPAQSAGYSVEVIGYFLDPPRALTGPVPIPARDVHYWSGASWIGINGNQSLGPAMGAARFFSFNAPAGGTTTRDYTLLLRVDSGAYPAGFYTGTMNIQATTY